MRYSFTSATGAAAAKRRRPRVPRERAYPDELVARVKGAKKALAVKAIERATGVPTWVIEQWLSGKRRAEVAPDPQIADRIFAMVRGE